MQASIFEEGIYNICMFSYIIVDNIVLCIFVDCVQRTPYCPFNNAKELLYTTVTVAVSIRGHRSLVSPIYGPSRRANDKPSPMHAPRVYMYAGTPARAYTRTNTRTNT